MCSKACGDKLRAGWACFQSSSLESPAKGEDLSMRSMWWKRGSDGSWLFKAPHSPSANLRHRNTAGYTRRRGQRCSLLHITCAKQVSAIHAKNVGKGIQS